MMRKDVKLGFAIGGVLLAVVVVYVLVGTGGNNRNANTAGIVTEEPSTADTRNVSIPERDNASNANATDTRGGASGALPPPVGANNTSAAPANAPSLAVNDSQPKRDANGDLWGKALNEGQLLMTETPSPSPAATARTNTRVAPSDVRNSRDAREPRDARVPESTTDRPTEVVGGGDGVNTPSAVDGPTTNPSAANDSPAPSRIGSIGDDRSINSRDRSATTHVVQKGETLAMISQAAYGNANFYPHILRANPGLVAEKMRPGTTIHLPPTSAVKPSPANDPNAPIAGASVASLTADPRTQYKVESGDSLYKIAMKLYGKPEMSDKLYEANKDTIGADRAKLKLHMMLKLPEPPTTTASR